jgi:hypothetical protein
VPDDKCPNMPTCAMFPLFKMGALRVWQEAYCERDFAACARYQRSQTGKMAPMNLLPNGKMLELGGKKK